MRMSRQVRRRIERKGWQPSQLHLDAVGDVQFHDGDGREIDTAVGIVSVSVGDGGDRFSIAWPSTVEEINRSWMQGMRTA